MRQTKSNEEKRCSPQYFLLAFVVTVVTLLLLIQNKSRGNQPLQRCRPITFFDLLRLKTLSHAYFRRHTIPAYPQETAIRILKERFYYNLPSTRECQQYKHEVTQCGWAMMHDITDAVMPADAYVTIIVALPWWKYESFLTLLKYWKGPISVTFYIEDEDLEHSMKILTYLRENIYISIVIANGLYYPTNLLRNAALNGTRTDCTFLMDVDFIPSINTEQEQTQHCRDMKTNTMLVVPSFYAIGRSVKHDILSSKDNLLNEVTKMNSNVFPMTGLVPESAHRNTNYSLWYISDKAYQIKYELLYEPFVMLKTPEIQLFPELFMGNHFDRASIFVNMLPKRFDMAVLPDSFVVKLYDDKLADALDHRNCSEALWSSWRYYFEQVHDIDLNKYDRSKAAQLACQVTVVCCLLLCYCCFK